MSDKVPSIDTPVLLSSQFREPHILLNVVGFAHDAIASRAQGYRSDQVWGLARFAPCTDLDQTAGPSESIDLRTYQSALTDHESWRYGKFPLREFGAMREGVVWSRRSRNDFKGLRKFKGKIYPHTARLMWQTEIAGRFIWVDQIPDESLPLSQVPVPKFAVFGDFEQIRPTMPVLLSCADILWYFAGYSSELLVGLLNGAFLRPQHKFYRQPYVMSERSIDIWPKNYNRSEKFAAAIELANILTYGDGAKAFIAQLGKMLVKVLSPHSWPVLSPRVTLPFTRPVDIEVLGYTATVPYESAHPDNAQIRFTRSVYAVNAVQIRKMASKRTVETIRIFVPEPRVKQSVSAGASGAFITRGQGREILGTTQGPADIDLEARSIELRPKEFVAPSAGIKIEKVNEQRDRDLNAPQYQVVSADVELGSFAEPFSSHSLHAAMDFTPGIDLRIKQTLAEAEPLPPRQLFDQCPNVPMASHILDLEVIDGEPYLNPEVAGDEVAFPIPHVAQILNDIAAGLGAEIEVLGEDWHSITEGHFSVLEFPHEWPKTKSLRSTNKTRNLVAMVARVRLSGAYSYLFAVERQLRNGIYEGRRLFALKPLFSGDLKESLINDILYFVARDQHDTPGQNGWPTDTDLCGEAKCRERSLSRIMQDTESVKRAFEQLMGIT